MTILITKPAPGMPKNPLSKTNQMQKLHKLIGNKSPLSMAQLSHDTNRINQLSTVVLDAAIAVHKEIGPGLLETVYQYCMIKELMNRDIQVQRNVVVPLYYKGEPLNKDYIIDILVEDEIILELKATELILPVHEAQLISYLKLADKRLGFLINFNVSLLKLGFKRFVNKL